MGAGKQVTDAQVKELRLNLNQGASLSKAAMKAGMSSKTAGKYRDLGQLPSETRTPHTWRTRTDPLVEVWPALEQMLQREPTLQAKTLFEWLQRQNADQNWGPQRRTLERRVRQWKAEHGPDKEVFFSQVHEPGRLGSSDFTHMDDLRVTIQGQPFPHLLYHFVLTHSNWEHVTVCFSESFASLSEGWQNAVGELGGVPERHRTDRLTLAVHHDGNVEEFTARYRALLGHYGVTPEATNAYSGHENGDCEQSHRRFKEMLEQELLLRGSRDFASRAEYEKFLRELLARRNALRGVKMAAEQARLRPLPARRLETQERRRVRVGQGSTIQVKKNTYSVPARLRGEEVEVRIGAETIEVWYAGALVQTMERLRGQSKHRIDYRHVIGWLVRKPGAFARYVYRADMYPTVTFRRAYDLLQTQQPGRADRVYLEVLELAAREGEVCVEEALVKLLDQGRPVSVQAVRTLLGRDTPLSVAAQVSVPAVDLRLYDALLEGASAAENDVGTSPEDGGLPEGASPAENDVGMSPEDRGLLEGASPAENDVGMFPEDGGLLEGAWPAENNVGMSPEGRGLLEGAWPAENNVGMSPEDRGLLEGASPAENDVGMSPEDRGLLEGASPAENNVGMSSEDRNKEEPDEQGPDGGVDTLPARTKVGDGTEPARGRGAAGDGGDLELRELPAGVAAARVPAAATQPDRTLAESVAVAVGEELVGPGPEASAGESGAAVAWVAERRLSGPTRECFGIWSAGLREDTRLVCGGPGIGAGGPADLGDEVQLVGAGTPEGEAGPASEGSAARVVALGGPADRRPGLCAAEPGGDGGLVHAVGGTLRAWQRAGDEQPGVLPVGTDLQGSDDDGGGDRPAGAPQRDPGDERAELSRGGSEADTRRAATEGRLTGGVGRPERWPGYATLAFAALWLAPLRQATAPARFASAVVPECHDTDGGGDRQPHSPPESERVALPSGGTAPRDVRHQAQWLVGYAMLVVTPLGIVLLRHAAAPARFISDAWENLIVANGKG
jgi:hypothetical protein